MEVIRLAQVGSPSLDNRLKGQPVVVSESADPAGHGALVHNSKHCPGLDSHYRQKDLGASG